MNTSLGEITGITPTIMCYEANLTTKRKTRVLDSNFNPGACDVSPGILSTGTSVVQQLEFFSIPSIERSIMKLDEWKIKSTGLGSYRTNVNLHSGV